MSLGEGPKDDKHTKSKGPRWTGGWYEYEGSGRKKKKTITEDSVMKKIEFEKNQIEYSLKAIQDWANENEPHGHYEGIARSYWQIAEGYSYLGKEPEKIVDSFRLAAEFYIKQQDMFGYYLSSAYSTAIYAICSRDKDLIQNVTDDVIRKARKSHSTVNIEYNRLLYNALFDTLLYNDQMDKSIASMDEFLYNEGRLQKGVGGGSVGTALAFHSIVKKNSEKFISGIRSIIQKVNKTYKRYNYLPISTGATYLIFLARDKGLDISKGLLEERFEAKYHKFFRQCLMMD